MVRPVDRVASLLQWHHCRSGRGRQKPGCRPDHDLRWHFLRAAGCHKFCCLSQGTHWQEMAAFLGSPWCLCGSFSFQNWVLSVSVFLYFWLFLFVNFLIVCMGHDVYFKRLCPVCCCLAQLIMASIFIKVTCVLDCLCRAYTMGLSGLLKTKCKT